MQNQAGFCVNTKKGMNTTMGDISIIARRLDDGHVQYGWSGNGGYFRNVGMRLWNQVLFFSAETQRNAERSSQVNSIKEAQTGKIGFITTAGYEETPDEFDCISVEALYSI